MSSLCSQIGASKQKHTLSAMSEISSWRSSPRRVHSGGRRTATSGEFGISKYTSNHQPISSRDLKRLDEVLMLGRRKFGIRAWNVNRTEWSISTCSAAHGPKSGEAKGIVFLCFFFYWEDETKVYVLWPRSPSQAILTVSLIAKSDKIGIWRGRPLAAIGGARQLSLTHILHST